MKADPETIRVYDSRAVEYADLTHNEAQDKNLADFIACLPDGGRVLDLGCGPGVQSAHMRLAGLEVVSLDASREMAMVAKQRFAVVVRVATFDEIDQVGEFDGIWASFSLLHAPRSAMPRHLAALHRALRPAGQFFIQLKTGTGEQRDSIGRLYTYYTGPEIHGLLETAGFTVTGSLTGEDAGLSGDVAPWLAVTAHA